MLGRKVEKSAARMEKILSTMVLQKHEDEADIIFSTMSGTLVNNTLGKCLLLIRRGSYHASAEDRR